MVANECKKPRWVRASVRVSWACTCPLVAVIDEGWVGRGVITPLLLITLPNTDPPLAGHRPKTYTPSAYFRQILNPPAKLLTINQYLLFATRRWLVGVVFTRGQTPVGLFLTLQPGFMYCCRFKSRIYP